MRLILESTVGAFHLKGSGLKRQLPFSFPQKLQERMWHPTQTNGSTHTVTFKYPQFLDTQACRDSGPRFACKPQRESYSGTRKRLRTYRVYLYKNQYENKIMVKKKQDSSHKSVLTVFIYFLLNSHISLCKKYSLWSQGRKHHPEGKNVRRTPHTKRKQQWYKKYSKKATSSPKVQQKEKRKKHVWLSGSLHIEERLNERPRLQWKFKDKNETKQM